DLLSEGELDFVGNAKAEPPITSSNAITATASATSNSTQGGDLLDFLNMGGDDFSVMAATAPSTSANSSSTQQKPVQQLEQDRKLWRKLFLISSSVLYEDNLLQIGVKSQVEPDAGVMKLILFYGNKTAAPLQSVSVKLNNVEGVEFELSPSDSFDVDAQQQQQQKCRISLIQPPTAIPTAQISFVSKGQPYQINAQFPVIVTKFFSAYSFDGAQFRQRWEQVPKEDKLVIRIGGEKVSLADVKKFLVEHLNIALIDGVDKKPENFVGCSRLTFASKRQGKNVTFPVLLRIEVNEPKQAIRITARTPHEAATKAVLQAFQSHFKKKKKHVFILKDKKNL
ncbi:adaptor-related protein complex 2, alpha subunit, partial [Reticulomyxa filosa]